MSFAGVWNLEATLTEQDVKTAIFGIGFDPKQVSKATCVEGAFCVTFADLQSGLALAVALDDLDPKHDIFKDSNGGVRACVWPRPSSGVFADFFHEMPPDLEVFVARQAASQIAEGSSRPRRGRCSTLRTEHSKETTKRIVMAMERISCRQDSSPQ